MHPVSFTKRFSKAEKWRSVRPWCKVGPRGARKWADKNMLSHRALVRVTDIRQQLHRHVMRVVGPARSCQTLNHKP